jgi:adenosylcobinamide-phosphate synthase
MTRGETIAAAYLLDCVLGDPEWLPHPVQLMGCGCSAGERALRRWSDGLVEPERRAAVELLAGALLTAGIVGGSYLATAAAIRWMHRFDRRAGAALEVLLAWTCLAARSLDDEARSVLAALAENDELDHARMQLARIVGRDTAHLDEVEICRAVIETVAESASDGIVSPLFYMALGGVPLAMAYKAANTLDSMIGHADARYFYFGKTAARLDDLANLIPSRLTALAIAGVAGLGGRADARQALTVWHRDGHKHKSPNAGQPEGAMSGALGVRLGGENRYAGEVIRTPVMGAEFPAATVPQAERALRIVAGVAAIGALAAMILGSRLLGSPLLGSPLLESPLLESRRRS